jgi:hypothetical protein
MDRYRRLFFALILGGLVLSISPTRSALADRVIAADRAVLASAATDPGGRGAGLTAADPWRDRDVYVPVRRENRSGHGRGPLLPLAVIATITAAGLCRCIRRSRRVGSLLGAGSLRSRAPPVSALPLLP